MKESKPHMVGLGNALVDVVAPVDHRTVSRHGLTPGGMHLVDDVAAQALFDEVAPGVRQSGGSVANSVAQASEAGLKTTYLGKTAEDSLGRTFRQELSDLGVASPVRPVMQGPGTGRCVVLVTPDGERTMSTYLGAAVEMTPGDIADAFPPACDLLLVEGYLWDAPQGAEVIVEASDRARACGARIALTPSDPGCATRNLHRMRAFATDRADIVIGNEEETAALFDAESAEDALARAARTVEVAVVTRSERGAIATRDGRIVHIDPAPVPRVVDSTGAGDAFAAGFLAALLAGDGLAEAGRAGTARAGRVLDHFGARNGPVAEALSLAAAG